MTVQTIRERAPLPGVDGSASKSPRGSLCYALALLAVGLSVFGSAASAIEPGAKTRARLDKAVQVEGSVRVIFSLDPTIKLTDPGTGTKASAQRSEIRARQDDFIASLGLPKSTDSVARFQLAPWLAMEVDAPTLERLYARKDVHHLVEDTVHEPLLQQSVGLIGADDAWAGEYIGTGYAVAVIDSGVGPHPFLDGRIVSEACFSLAGTASQCPGGATSSTAVGSGTACTIPNSSCGHGTHVAGIIAGRNGLGGTLNGVAYGSDIISIKIAHRKTCNGSPCMGFATSNRLLALEHVYTLRSTRNIAAVNMSLGANPQSEICDWDNIFEDTLISQLASNKIATVVATGNARETIGAGQIGTPACISSAISVGATNKAHQLARYSNIATFVDFVAPGSLICSSMVNPRATATTCGAADYFKNSGTSMAAPHIAGVWALMRSRNHGASVADIKSVLKATGIDVDTPVGPIKRVDLAAAIAALTDLTPLANDESVGQLAWNTSSKLRHFYIDVPADRSVLLVTTQGGSGNADIFVRLGSKPTASAFRCSSQGPGNGEECVIVNPEAGRWFIGIRPTVGYSGLNLTATYTRPPRSLLVRSGGELSIPITMVSGPAWGGSTNYLVQDITLGTSGVLSAPLTAPSGRYIFSRWLGCDAVSAVGGSWCEINFERSRNVVAVYAKIARSLRVRSLNVGRVAILGNPESVSGVTESVIGPSYDVTTGQDDVVSLTAPATAYAATFSHWVTTGPFACTSVSGPGNRTCNLTMNQNKVADAVYVNPTFNISVTATGTSNVTLEKITYPFLAPLVGSVVTPHSFVDTSGVIYGFEAPGNAGGRPFSGWTGCDAREEDPGEPLVTPLVAPPKDCQILIDEPRNLVAQYAAGDAVNGLVDEFDPSRWATHSESAACGASSIVISAGSVTLSTAESCGTSVARYTHAGATESGLLSFDYSVTQSAAHGYSASAGTLEGQKWLLADDEPNAGGLSMAVAAGQRVVLELSKTNGVGASTLIVNNLVFRRNLAATVPSAPLIGTAQRGDGEIVVPFTPASNGGSVLLDYTATCGAVSQSGTTSPIVVTGLVNGVTYTCSVVARNVYGTGAPSAPSNAVVPGGVPQSPLMGVATPIRAGGGHSCALDRLGGVYCWGRNGDGQLGDGTLVNRSTPVPVVGLASGVRAIATGGNHSCALTSAGGVVCWGRNEFGQLGDNSVINRPTPVAVTGLAAGIVSVTTAANHSCALTTVGGVKCWGRNSTGQLGDNSTTQRPAPVDVVGLANGIAEVVAGDHHSCARGIGGGVKCWGWNVFGQLGDGSNSDRPAPVDVSGLASGTTALGAGTFHSCAMRTNGAMSCWGRNDFGQLGDGTQSNRNEPVDVIGLGDAATAIGGGSSHTCALVSTGVKCWGLNSSGQLGDGTLTQRSTPAAPIAQTTGALALGAGASHNCALGANGELLCWGGNGQGQLGDGSTDNRFLPVRVQDLEVPAAVAGNASISVVFTPRSAGASPVIDYTVSCGGVSAVGAGSPIVVSGLVNGTTYTCSVVARSALGTSLPSPPSNSVTPRAPSNTSLSGPASSAAASSVTFTATVVGQSPGGSVAFLDGASAISGCAAITLTAGAAQCTTDTLGVGAHNLVAAYSGDAANTPSSSTVLVHNVTVGVPAAPTIGSATPGNAQISVAFVPGANGGSAILDYTATCGGVSQIGAGSPVVVIGLVNGTAYTCTVRARNTVGNSPASAPTGSVTPATVPNAPVIGSASAGDGEVSVSFTPPANNGGSALIDYTATCGAQSSSNPSSPISVGGLANGVAVNCSVVANNAIGSSAPSAASNSVTPRALTSTQLSGPATSNFGSAVELTATVTGSNNAGSAAFKDGAQTIAGCGTVAIVAGVASCSTSQLAVGAHALSAEYSGSAAHAPSVSAPLAHTVAAIAPAAPGNVVATPGNAQISVAFIAGANGGSPILDYTATCGAQSAVGAATPIVVTGLVNGTAYTCTVVARNAIGSSAPSAPSASVTPASVPGAPVIGAVTPGNASASVAFTAPGSNGGSAILGYTASCTPGAASSSGPASPLLVNGLNNGQIHHCSVLASNVIGHGPASASVAVIPSASTSADLSISKSNGVSYVSGGLPTTYQIVVSNPGPAGAASARVTDTLDPVFSLATWTCTGQGGAQCDAGGNGNLDTLVHLPPASSVSIELTATVAPLPENPVSNIAAVTPPVGIVDANLNNNVATDGPDVVGVFRSSFE